MAGVFGRKYVNTVVMRRFPRLAKAYKPVALGSKCYIMMIIIFIHTIQRERAKNVYDSMGTHRLHVKITARTTY